MKITLNGETSEFKENMSINDILAHHSIKPETVVIELNDQIINKAFWEKTIIKENDFLEIITFMGGGQWKGI